MAYKIYPVTQVDMVCEDYTVKVNGKPAALHTARVSKEPFNRRWPGHQRGLEQTELINFLSLETDEELFFEITPKRPFDTVAIRPDALQIQPEISDGCIRFSLKQAAYCTVEPFGRNGALHIFADPVSTYAIDTEDENVLYFGAGEHDIGHIELKSGQTLFIDEGAVVYACVKALDCENIKILGRGILDNSKNKAQIQFEVNAENNDMAVKNATREHTVQLEYCTNVLIDGITIRDSLVYNIRPIGCKNLHIRGVKIIGCWRYNSDGIDMHNCEDVLIENCFLRTFDDCLCVKGFDFYYAGDVEEAVKAAMYRNGKAYDTFKNVLVRNCCLWNDWGKCLEIGAETRAEEICDVVFEDCDILHVTGAPLDCYNVDYADVHHISFKNIRIFYDDIIPAPRIQGKDSEVYENHEPTYAPQLISVIANFHPEYSAGGKRRGKNRDILFENIYLSSSRHKPIAYFEGCADTSKTENVLIKNLHVNGTLVKDFTDGMLLGPFSENIRYQAEE